MNSIFSTTSIKKNKINYRYVNIIISKNLNYKINYNIFKNILAKILKQTVHSTSLKTSSIK